MLLDLLVQHRDRLRDLQLDNEGTRQVQNLVEEQRRLVEEKAAQVHRFHRLLEDLFSANVAVVSEVGHETGV